MTNRICIDSMMPRYSMFTHDRSHVLAPFRIRGELQLKINGELRRDMEQVIGPVPRTEVVPNLQSDRD